MLMRCFPTLDHAERVASRTIGPELVSSKVEGGAVGMDTDGRWRD